MPTGDYAAIMGQRRKDDPSLQVGPIYDMWGNKLGEHRGYAYYTIGQRKGFGVAAGMPLYVIRINPDDRSITVGSKDDLLARQFSVIDINLLVDPGEIPASVDIKIRYRHKGSQGHIDISGDCATVEFDQPERAITPGQSAVFYDGDRVLGGGVIERVLD